MVLYWGIAKDPQYFSNNIGLGPDHFNRNIGREGDHIDIRPVLDIGNTRDRSSSDGDSFSEVLDIEESVRSTDASASDTDSGNEDARTSYHIRIKAAKARSNFRNVIICSPATAQIASSARCILEIRGPMIGKKECSLRKNIN